MPSLYPDSERLGLAERQELWLREHQANMDLALKWSMNMPGQENCGPVG
jgi:hypothetical protein